MVNKFSLDAQAEQKERRRRETAIKQARASAAKRELVLKRVFLGIAVVGVAAGLYFAHELGAMFGEISQRRSDLQASYQEPPKSTAKRERRMAEMRRQREAELAEIQGTTGE